MRVFDLVENGGGASLLAVLPAGVFENTAKLRGTISQIPGRALRLLESHICSRNAVPSPGCRPGFFIIGRQTRYLDFRELIG